MAPAVAKSNKAELIVASVCAHATRVASCEPVNNIYVLAIRSADPRCGRLTFQLLGGFSAKPPRLSVFLGRGLAAFPMEKKASRCWRPCWRRSWLFAHLLSSPNN